MIMLKPVNPSHRRTNAADVNSLMLHTSPDCLSHLQQRIGRNRYLVEPGVLQIPFALVLHSVAYFYKKREPEKN